MSTKHFELFERARPTPMLLGWDRLLAFSPDGAKSATQKAIEELGMLQGVTAREITVSADGDDGHPVYLDQFGQWQDAVMFDPAEDDALFPVGFKVFEILDGRRRALDSWGAEDDCLNATVLPEDTNERTVAAVAAVLNIARKPNPLQEAQALCRLADTGMDDEQIADTLGIPLQTIRKRKRLLKLPADLRAAVADGKIKAGVAERIANLSSRQISQLQDVLKQHGSVKGKDIKLVQEAKVQADMGTLQLDMGFTPQAVDYPLISMEHPQEAFMKCARVLMVEQGISFTQLRSMLSDLNKELKG